MEKTKTNKLTQVHLGYSPSVNILVMQRLELIRMGVTILFHSILKRDTYITSSSGIVTSSLRFHHHSVWSRYSSNSLVSSDYLMILLADSLMSLGSLLWPSWVQNNFSDSLESKITSLTLMSLRSLLWLPHESLHRSPVAGAQFQVVRHAGIAQVGRLLHHCCNTGVCRRFWGGLGRIERKLSTFKERTTPPELSSPMTTLNMVPQ